MIHPTKLMSRLERAVEILRQEPADLRPPAADGQPGGMLLLDPNLPTLLLPDLHGRWQMLQHALELQYNGTRVADLLEEGKIQVVSLGDLMHSESRGKDRWKKANKEYKKGFHSCPAMTAEMGENLKTLAKALKYKIHYPRHFHILKGNHENIKNENQDGNHPFTKYAWEGDMCYHWTKKILGPEVLEAIYQYEKSLPILAKGGDFMTSHARPRRFYQEDEILNCRLYFEVVEGFTWTRNQWATPGAVERMLNRYLPDSPREPHWFAGHSSIKTLYDKVDGENLILFHNPALENVVLLHPDRPFDPYQDILAIDYERHQDEEAHQRPHLLHGMSARAKGKGLNLKVARNLKAIQLKRRRKKIQKTRQQNTTPPNPGAA